MSVDSIAAGLRQRQADKIKAKGFRKAHQAAKEARETAMEENPGIRRYTLPTLSPFDSLSCKPT